ncbi:replication endonuclease [Vibrio parahaemolyticus]
MKKINSRDASLLIQGYVFNKNEPELLDILLTVKNEGIYKPQRYFNFEHKIKKMVGNDLALIFRSLYNHFDENYVGSSSEFEVSYNYNPTINEYATAKLVEVTKEYINDDFAKKIYESVYRKNGDFKKNAYDEILKFFDGRIMKRRFNQYVLSVQMTHEMSLGNVGDKRVSKTVECAKSYNQGSADNLNRYAPKNIINDVAKEKYDGIKAMKRMKAGNTGKSVYEVAKSAEAEFYEHYIEMLALTQMSEEKNFTWLFITLTCPPEYHSNPSNGKRAYKGHSVKDSDQYLNQKWRNLSRRFDKVKWAHLKFSTETGYGKKVKEPHKDGCVHYHLMLFCDQSLANDYELLFRSTFGRSEAACKIIRKGVDTDGKQLEDEQQASAATYIMKYVVKGMSAEISCSDRDMSKVIESEKLDIEAWRKAGGIRQISSFGFNGVRTKYQKARSINNKIRAQFDELREKLEADRTKIIDSARRFVVDHKEAEKMIRHIDKMLLLSRTLIRQTIIVHAKNEDEIEAIEKLANIFILAEKKSTFCKKSGKKLELVDYRKFMDSAAQLQYVVEEKENRRGSKTKVNVGFCLAEGGDAEVLFNKNSLN